MSSGEGLGGYAAWLEKVELTEVLCTILWGAVVPVFFSSGPGFFARLGRRWSGYNLDVHRGEIIERLPNLVGTSRGRYFVEVCDAIRRKSHHACSNSTR